MYEYTVMSFGLTNALAYFMYLMNKVFMEYLDNLSLYSLTTYWFTPKTRKNMKNIFVWFYKSSEKISYMPNLASVSFG